MSAHAIWFIATPPPPTHKHTYTYPHTTHTCTPTPTPETPTPHLHTHTHTPHSPPHPPPPTHTHARARAHMHHAPLTAVGAEQFQGGKLNRRTSTTQRVRKWRNRTPTYTATCQPLVTAQVRHDWALYYSPP